MTTLQNLLLSLERAANNLDSQAAKAISEEILQTIKTAKVNGIDHYYCSLNSALAEYNDTEAAYLCKQLIKDLRNPNFDQAHWNIDKVLALLNKYRKFELIVNVAETALQSFECEPKVTKLYAQAMIELKLLIPSIHLLKDLEKHCIHTDCESELVEARGLLGRAYKQIYIDSALHSKPNPTAQNALRNAIEFYLNEFQRCPKKRTWHGINAVALCRRAEIDRLSLTSVSSHSVLNELIKIIEDKLPQKNSKTTHLESGELDIWITATYAEALIANAQPVEALQWLTKYIDGESAEGSRADAFQIASTLRQLEEVWQLRHDHPEEKRIIDVLKAALLSREGGSIRVKSPAAELTTVNSILQIKEFEKVFGHDRYKNLLWYKTGLEQAGTVCRIEDRMGRGIGTGFLIHSSSLGLNQLDQWMVLTNAHVVSSDRNEQISNPGALAPEDAYIRFEAGDVNSESVTITGIVATSGRYDLDFTLLSIQGVSGNPVKLPISKSLPLVGANERLYIIGHPKGGGLSFSLHDNLLLDHENPKIHYRSPTEGGSSGSPVFNESWELIGLHHSGSQSMKKLNGKIGHYEANEGICILSVISAIKKQLGH